MRKRTGSTLISVGLSLVLCPAIALGMLPVAAIADDGSSAYASADAQRSARETWQQQVQGSTIGIQSSQTLLQTQSVTSNTKSASAKNELTRTNNLWKHEYVTFPEQTARSFLHVAPSGDLERVEFTGSKLVVEKVSANFKTAVSRYVVPKSTYLPSDFAGDGILLWGGFFSGVDSNYVLTGQFNDFERDDVTVFRVSKYEKDWTYVASVELKGANTAIPFDAGTCDMTEAGGRLYIRTSHEMYASDDGLNHQANVHLVVDEASMAVVESSVDVSQQGDDGGYVSHSFSQHLAVLAGNVYGIDHGDAYPRAVTVKQLYGAREHADVFAIPGEEGENNTGVSLGGFESSETAGTLLSVGNMTDLGAFVAAGYDDSEFVRNVWVGVTRPDLTSSVAQLTNYSPTGSRGADTPFLVKVNDDRFAVIWGECGRLEDFDTPGKHTGTIRYQFIDGNASAIDGVRSAKGVLSDCQPVLYNGDIVWYASGSGSPSFYRIDAQTGSFAKTELLSSASIVLKGYSGSDETISLDEALSFADSKQTGITVTLNGVKLKKGTHFSRSFKVNRKKAQLEVILKGKGKFAGQKASNAFPIKPKKLKAKYIADIPDRKYTGKRVTPKLTARYRSESSKTLRKVYFNGKLMKREVVYNGPQLKLKRGIDYSVTYKNNVRVGKAVAIVKGKGVFAGTVNKAFLIKKRVS